MFYWKSVDVPRDELERLIGLYKQITVPHSLAFFQSLDIGVQEFMSMPVESVVLIQAPANQLGDIHVDYRYNELALNIPLENCELSVTNIWESRQPPVFKTSPTGVPYRSYDRSNCHVIDSYRLTSPVLFRTNVPHSVDNPTDQVRRALSIRFVQDPWHLIAK
jgi:hypothetical protein